MERRLNKHLREVFNTIIRQEKCQYLIVDKNLNIIDYSDDIGFYDLSEIDKGTKLYSLIDELLGYEEELQELFNDKDKTIEIPFITKKDDVFINISVLRGDGDSSLVVLIEDVSRYATIYKRSIHDRNEKELLLEEVQKKNAQLLRYNEEMENLVQEEIEKNKQKQLMLIQQSKLASMGDMITNIAHQWKQPLNALSAISNAIVLRHNLGKLDEDNIDNFSKNSEILITQMSNTIDDFMNFFKPNKKKKYFNITDSLNRVNSLVKPNLEPLGIVLSFNEKDSYMIFAHQNELEQVLVNIIHNAKDISVEKQIENPIINIEVSQDNQYCCINIYDNAGGVPKNIIDKIFDPYFSTKEENKGTGIGLHMSKLIIESHMQGTLSVHNTDLGACFTIKLKRLENAQNQV